MLLMKPVVLESKNRGSKLDRVDDKMYFAKVRIDVRERRKEDWVDCPRFTDFRA